MFNLSFIWFVTGKKCAENITKSYKGINNRLIIISTCKYCNFNFFFASSMVLHILKLKNVQHVHQIFVTNTCLRKVKIESPCQDMQPKIVDVISFQPLLACISSLFTVCAWRIPLITFMSTRNKFLNCFTRHFDY